MDLHINPQKTALLVIDMQADFYAPNGGAAKRGKLVSNMQNVATKINHFLDQINNKVSLIVFTKYISGTDVTPLNLQSVAKKERYDLACKKGTGQEDLSGVKVAPGAIVIEKPHYDAFAYTNLLTLMKERDIKTVLVAGVRTEVCVDATAKRAASEGFNTVIMSDLVATYDDKEQVHQGILEFFNKYYGYVLDSATVLSLVH